MGEEVITALKQERVIRHGQIVCYWLNIQTMLWIIANSASWRMAPMKRCIVSVVRLPVKAGIGNKISDSRIKKRFNFSDRKQFRSGFLYTHGSLDNLSLAIFAAEEICQKV
jgi:hypothetical protein